MTDVTNTADDVDNTSEQENADNARAIPGSNSDAIKKAYRKFLAGVGELGTANGKGATSLVALAERLTQGAMDGVILPEHAKDIYDRFQKASLLAQGKLLPEVANEKSAAAQASKLNAFIKLGHESDKYEANPEVDDEGNPFIEDAVDLMEKARKAFSAAKIAGDAKQGPMPQHKNAYAAMCAVAVDQRREEHKGVWMSESHLQGLIAGEEGEAKEKTAFDLIKTAHETLLKAQAGRAGSDTRPAREGIDHEYLSHALGHLWNLMRELNPGYTSEIENKARAQEDKAAARAAKKAARTLGAADADEAA